MNVQRTPGSCSMMQRKPLRQLGHFLNDAIRYAVKRGETLTKSVSAEELLTEEIKYYTSSMSKQNER